MLLDNTYILYTPEVFRALSTGTPVIALESAGIFEEGTAAEKLAAAEAAEAAVRENGAVPALTAVIGGKIRAGLSDEDKQLLASEAQPRRASRRDIPLLLVKRQTAVTTIAATMLIAGLSGIRVVSGGAIGGVHRDAAASMDISADLDEFVRSDVLVVCSGARSVLDLRMTMEYLETRSVPVAGYRTDELPAYTSRESGIRLENRLDTPEEAAAVFRAKCALGISGGMLLANPIPNDFAADSERLNESVDIALAQAAQRNISGKGLTKFIMNTVLTRMGHDSREARRQLFRANAALAAEIAKLL